MLLFSFVLWFQLLYSFLIHFRNPGSTVWSRFLLYRIFPVTFPSVPSFCLCVLAVCLSVIFLICVRVMHVFSFIFSLWCKCYDQKCRFWSWDVSWCNVAETVCSWSSTFRYTVRTPGITNANKLVKNCPQNSRFACCAIISLIILTARLKWDGRRQRVST